MKTQWKRLLCAFLAFVMLMSVAGCAEKAPEVTTSGTDASTETTEKDSRTSYNVIFTLATIPPVMAALESISSGNDTYALIERGKTYSGIESVDGFYNAGFDPANNLSEGFTATELDAMVAKVKELKGKTEDTFFNIYVQDGTALLGAAIAANAGLTTEQFHIYMVEDGTGAYSALNTDFVAGKVVDSSKDEVYDNYVAQVAAAKAEFETIMSKTDNLVTDAPMAYNIGKAFALAALDNFTFIIQDEDTIVNILKSTGEVATKLLSCFSAEGYDAEVEHTLNLKYQKIVDGVAALTEDQKTDYLTLMYGQYFADTYAALTRTQRADQSAPAQKLVYIGTRHGGYPHFASNADYGIGGLAAEDTVPASYAELDAKYKSALLFAQESDYTAFLAELNNAENYDEGVTDEAKAKAQVAAFNVYIDYIFNLKFTYAMYGNEYDLIMKGHPREVIGGHEEWGGKYVVELTDGSTYIYDKLLDNLLLTFHADDSVGKLIGMVPYGTAAENLAYLGADLSICGLPSSTYNGYDTNVDVLFIMTETDQDITGSGEAEAASQVAARYEAGNLTFTDKNGEKQNAAFYNTGNTYKTAAQILEAAGDTEGAAAYNDLYEAWLAAVHGDATDVDAQGFAK